MLRKYIIVENMDSKELSVISQDKYTDEMHYRYEPIAGCDDISEATELCEHIRLMGVQEYLSGIAKRN